MDLLTEHWQRAGFAGKLPTKVNAFIDLFLKWNKSINLSAARDREALAEHVADCFYFAARVPGSAATMIDVGAGGGLPGVLVAITRPQTVVMSIEPVHKKHAFLRTAARELGLTNYDARAERIEDHPTRNYDVAGSRATWALDEWMARGQTLVRPGGLVLGMEAAITFDVPGMQHWPYEFLGKKRAIVGLTVAATQAQPSLAHDAPQG